MDPSSVDLFWESMPLCISEKSYQVIQVLSADPYPTYQSFEEFKPYDFTS